MCLGSGSGHIAWLWLELDSNMITNPTPEGKDLYQSSYTTLQPANLVVFVEQSFNSNFYQPTFNVSQDRIEILEAQATNEKVLSSGT